MKPATALPWCTMPAQHGGKLIRGFDCTDVARIGLDINHGERTIEENARYIVHAANAYSKLVEALRALTEAEKHRRVDEDAVYNAQNNAAALLRELGEA